MCSTIFVSSHGRNQFETPPACTPTLNVQTVSEEPVREDIGKTVGLRERRDTLTTVLGHRTSPVTSSRQRASSGVSLGPVSIQVWVRVSEIDTQRRRSVDQNPILGVKSLGSTDRFLTPTDLWGDGYDRWGSEGLSFRVEEGGGWELDGSTSGRRHRRGWDHNKPKIKNTT